MLDSVIVARDRFLKPGGLVAPSQCSIILSAVSDEAVYNDTVKYWDDIYGEWRTTGGVI
jgi:protein arginine N-methyltransferase 3